MARAAIAAALAGLALGACSPPWEARDPRDRLGDAAQPATWRVVDGRDGAAATLARPGGAPDLVLWCRRGAPGLTLRAHVFRPAGVAEMTWRTGARAMTFGDLSVQGGLRDSGRALIEGRIAAAPSDLAAFADVTLAYGGQTYAAPASDPQGALAAFQAACARG